MKTRPVIACALLLVLCLAACNGNKNAQTAENANNGGQTATQPAQPPAQPPATATQPPAQENTPAAPAATTPANKAAKSAAPVAPPAPAASAPPEAAANTAPEPPPPPKPQPIVIPAGTNLSVRLDDALSSESAKEGDRFQGTLSHSVAVNGKVVVPTGAKVGGTVTQAHEAGRFKGGATLGLSLDTLTVRGMRYKIRAAAETQQSKGKGKRSATMIGGGTGLGAIVGGIAGGGKGAAIGAIAGGGAGTAGAGLTGDRDIKLPAESVLSFRMSHSLTLNGANAAPSAAAGDQEAVPDTPPEVQQRPPQQ